MVRNVPPKLDEDDESDITPYRVTSRAHTKRMSSERRNTSLKEEATTGQEQLPSSQRPSFVPSTQKQTSSLLSKSFHIDRTFGSNNNQRLLMKSVPSHVKKDFLKIGFAYFGKEYLPLLQLSPFHIPPGRLRNLWIQMFRKVRGAISF